MDAIWTVDLVDISSFFSSSNGYKYLLTVIDVFSKYGCIVPLKAKTCKKVANTFCKLYANTVLSRIWTDKGTALYNQQLKAVLTVNDVTPYYAEERREIDYC